MPFALAQERNPGLTEQRFVDDTARAMRAGRFLLVIAGDGIHEDVSGIAQLINSNAASAFSFGLAYAARDGNQVTYLLDGLRRVDPDFLRSDWLAAETFAYHPTFAWVIIAAAALGSVPWVLALLNIAIITASLWLIHRLLRDFDNGMLFDENDLGGACAQRGR